jgi:hypothetical protein
MIVEPGCKSLFVAAAYHSLLEAKHDDMIRSKVCKGDRDGLGGKDAHNQRARGNHAQDERALEKVLHRLLQRLHRQAASQGGTLNIRVNYNYEWVCSAMHHKHSQHQN